MLESYGESQNGSDEDEIQNETDRIVQDLMKAQIPNTDDPEYKER